MDPMLISMTVISVLVVLTALFSVGLVNRYTKHPREKEKRYWHLDAKKNIRGDSTMIQKTIIEFSQKPERYGQGIVKGIQHYGTLDEAEKKLAYYKNQERIIWRLFENEISSDITADVLDLRLNKINEQKLIPEEHERAVKLMKEIKNQGYKIFNEVYQLPGTGEAATFEVVVKGIIIQGILNGETDHEIISKAIGAGITNIGY